MILHSLEHTLFSGHALSFCLHFEINLVVKGKSAKIHRTANVIVQASFKPNQARIVKPQKETLKVCLLSLVHLKEAGLMKKVGCLKFIALVLKYHGHQLS